MRSAVDLGRWRWQSTCWSMQQAPHSLDLLPEVYHLDSIGSSTKGRCPGGACGWLSEQGALAGRACGDAEGIDGPVCPCACSNSRPRLP